MAEKLEGKLAEAIESIADKITGDVKADDTLKLTQAALNVAHTIHMLRNKPNSV